MRFGGVLSVVIHVGLTAAGLIVAPALAPVNPTPFMILPVELLEVSDTTNVIPVTEDAKDAEIADAKQAISEPAAAAPPPPPAEDTVALPTEEKPEPKKPESKKKAEPAPGKAKEQDFKSALQGILSDVKREDSPAPSTSTNRPTNLNTVNDAGARAGVGDMRQMTMTVKDAIKSQLLSKGCWTDQDDMADARRLRALISVRFGRNGKFVMAPKLVEPNGVPQNDPVLGVFIQRAFTALNKCNAMGFQIPPAYFDKMSAPEIEIDFLP